MSEEKEREYNILVYGIEKRGITAPSDPIVKRNYTLNFEPFNTDYRFNDYDGVILYQGIFENFTRKTNYINSYLDHYCDRDELDKRKNEANLLLAKGGFLCFLLNEVFIERDGNRYFDDSDLAKHHLNYRQFYRNNFVNRIANLDIKSDEFRKFLELYGAANTRFEHFNSNLDWRIIAEASDKTVGFIINKNQYFIPSLIPSNSPEIIQEYFNLLATSLTSSYNKLQAMIPEWVEKFSFSEEISLSTERQVLEDRICEIDGRKTVLSRYKSSLIYTGDELASCVSEIILHGFGLPVDTKDELREDFKILDPDGNPILLCEVKGTNKSVKRENINQADSHRERSGFSDHFPSLLIVNTHIKNSRNIIEKDQELAKEQIQHAVKMNILVLRTLDLLGLLKMHLDHQISKENIIQLFINNNGWLKVSKGNYKVVQNIEAE